MNAKYVSSGNQSSFWSIMLYIAVDRTKIECTNKASTMTELNMYSKIVSEYDREIPQSQTADSPVHSQLGPI